MDTRNRRIVGLIWLAVTAIVASTLELAIPSTGNEILRLFVVLMSLFLAVVYLFDPWDLADEK